MRPSSIVKVCMAVVVASVVIVCGLNFSNTDDAEHIKTLNKNVTQNYGRTAVTSKVSAVKPGDTVNMPGITSTPDLSDWVECVKECHKLWFSQGVRYTYGGSVSITNFDGNPITIRNDCSGFVSFCLYTSGYASSPTATTSSGPWEQFGFGLVDRGSDGVYTLDDLWPGDIVAWPGSHVQIYVGPTPEDKWYDWGNTAMIERAYFGQDLATADPVSGLGNSHTLSSGYVYRKTSP